MTIGWRIITCSMRTPVIILADGAYVRVEGRKTSLVRGDAWLLRKGQEKEKIVAGKTLTLRNEVQEA